MSEQAKENAEQLAELLAKVPEDQRKIVTAQVMGTIQGVVLADSLKEAKTA